MPTAPLVPTTVESSKSGNADGQVLPAELGESLSAIKREIDYLRIHVNSEGLLAELIQIVSQIEQELSSLHDGK